MVRWTLRTPAGESSGPARYGTDDDVTGGCIEEQRKRGRVQPDPVELMKYVEKKSRKLAAQQDKSLGRMLSLLKVPAIGALFAGAAA